MDVIIEISALENPRVPNSIEIGQVFGHFLVGPPPKKSVLVKKWSDQILVPFSYSAH